MLISREGMVEKTGSLFKLCNLASMRAVELNQGMKELVEVSTKEKITTIALKEILEGKVTLKEDEEDEGKEE